MATYKKKGFKRKTKDLDKNQSTTAEVFDTLDQSASSTEKIVAKYQNYIVGFVITVVVIVLGFLGYSSLILEPKSDEANNELFTAQNYFSQALVDAENSDSLFSLSLNGGEGKYGFLDIIENYSATKASNLAYYSAGMAYFNLNDFENAIEHLKNFDSDDEILSALEKPLGLVPVTIALYIITLILPLSGTLGDSATNIVKAFVVFTIFSALANSIKPIFEALSTSSWLTASTVSYTHLTLPTTPYV